MSQKRPPTEAPLEPQGSGRKNRASPSSPPPTARISTVCGAPCAKAVFSQLTHPQPPQATIMRHAVLFGGQTFPSIYNRTGFHQSHERDLTTPSVQHFERRREVTSKSPFTSGSLKGFVDATAYWGCSDHADHADHVRFAEGGGVSLRNPDFLGVSPGRRGFTLGLCSRLLLYFLLIFWAPLALFAKSFAPLKADTTPPVLDVPANMTVYTKDGFAIVTFAATATDNVTVNPQISYSAESGFWFPVGVTTVRVIASDEAGNQTSGTFTVTVITDNERPVWRAPENLKVKATGWSGTRVYYPPPSVTDNVTANPTVTYSKPSGSVFPVGTTDVEAWAMDEAGNSISISFTVTVQLPAKPAFTKPAVKPFRVLLLGAFIYNLEDHVLENRADELRRILENDPAFSECGVEVACWNTYQRRRIGKYSIASTDTLMGWFYWPAGRATNLALLRDGWDYVLMFDQHIEKTPQYALEGVQAIAREVQKAGSKPLLLMQCQNDPSEPFDPLAEMVYRVGDGAEVPVVPAGAAWRNLPQDMKGDFDADKWWRVNSQQAYFVAACIYSQMLGRSAALSNYVPPVLSPAWWNFFQTWWSRWDYDTDWDHRSHVPPEIPQTERDALAEAALSGVQFEAAKSHYEGVHRSATHFAVPLNKKRSILYTDYDSSTEAGIREGLSSVLSLARVGWTRKFGGYQKFPRGGYPFDFAQSRFSCLSQKEDPREEAALVKNYAWFDFQEEGGRTSMVYNLDMVRGYNESARDFEPYNSTHFFVPLRVLWARLLSEQPNIPSQPDGHHISRQYNQGIAAMMYTLLSGRCAVGDEPANRRSVAWQNWICRKTGYEIAWQYATLKTRVPGFEVLPSGIKATQISDERPQTLTVRFLYPPASNVIVNVGLDNDEAATVTPGRLVFTPENYQKLQTVTVRGAAGFAGAGSVNVRFGTVSEDGVFNELSDEWKYQVSASN
jgi:hypothetical protein